MARTGSGVEVRATSIRLNFVLDGKPQRHTLMLAGVPMPPTPANLRYATRLAAEIREKIKHGTFSLAEYFPASKAGTSPTTLRMQFETWLPAQRITQSTKQGYEGIIRFWNAELGDKLLRALKVSDILLALGRNGHIAGKTVNARVSVLRQALDLAVDDNLIQSNPVGKVPRAKQKKPPVEPFSQDEVEAILADMRKHYDPSIAEYMEFKFFTGLRTGESFGLRWSNVDLASKRIVVAEGITNGIEVDNTKTGYARTVLLNSRAFAALKAQEKRTFLEGGHVWRDPRTGKTWEGEPKFRYFWTPTLKRLKMRYRRPYNSRHTYATLMLMRGLTPAFCAGQMGHSVELFLKTYAKWLPGAQDAAEMAKLETSPVLTQESKKTGTHGA